MLLSPDKENTALTWERSRQKWKTSFHVILIRQFPIYREIAARSFIQMEIAITDGSNEQDWFYTFNVKEDLFPR